MIPFGLRDIEQERACRVRSVGQMILAAGETPEQKAIDRTESELAIFSSRTGVFHMIKQPRNLARGKIWIEQQPGPAGNCALVAGVPQRFAILCRAPILPYDGVVDCLSGLAVPKDRSLPLVGD